MATQLWRRLAYGVGLVWAIAGVAHGQYYEDSMEPEEIGIRDLTGLRVPGAAYVGNDRCRLCHEAAYQTWLGTAHARAFVPMRSMMGMAMGEQQGVTACCPAKSGKCLSCHATGHDVPAAYRGPGFRMGEGVACEKCHGPGADHVRSAEDPGSGPGIVAELEIETFCHTCHSTRPGHEKIKPKMTDVAAAWRRIAHPMSAERPEDEMEPEELGIWHLRGQREPPESAFVGSAACGECHADAYDVWAGSAHAAATAALGSQMGVDMGMVMDMNVVGGATKNSRCLRCHATGHDAPAASRAAGFSMREGVGCERCHGPGAAHIRAAHRGGQNLELPLLPADGSCMECHKRQRSHAELDAPVFSFPRAWGQIAH
jgi:hypothetical protein